uniref:U6 snRNA-associated Sm-like protein LSm1 n=1 Tax=Panagrolaimus sp. JU765 TaxID=591449 RepID=A0AC34QLD9_9BILA
MELPEPFLPGAISLLDQLDKKMLLLLRDGKVLVGYLRTIDQFANLVLHNTVERIHVDNHYGDIQRGIYLVRGENVVLAGELDEEHRPNNLIKVSVDEILELQAKKIEQKRELDSQKAELLKSRGKTLPKDEHADLLGDDPF